MEEVNRQAIPSDPLLTCCLCRRLLQDAVQLICLHNCCRACFSAATSTGSIQNIACGSCFTITQAGRQEPNAFIDSQVQRHKSITESGVCGKCKENSEYDKPAVARCPACRLSFCKGCLSLHGQYFRQHVTQLLDELRSLDDVFSHESPSACLIHKKPLDVACRTCEQAKCISCWAECNEKKHEMHVVGKDSFDSYIAKFVTSISTMENELLRKSKILEKPKQVLQNIKAARNHRLEDLHKRKRRVMDAVEMVYQEIEFSTRNAYDNLEEIGDSVAEAADRIASDLSDARNYIRRLVESNDKCEILKQQKIVRERLSVLSAMLDALGDRLDTTMGEVKIEASLPEDLDKVVREWFGLPLIYSGSTSSSLHPEQHRQPHEQQTEPQQPEQQPEQQQQHELQQQQQQSKRQLISFGTDSTSVQLPVACVDVALTTDGRRLLLAAGRHGLIELCALNGGELSRWLPPMYRPSEDSDRDDEVQAVAALSGERAAVSLHHARLVVLLRRSEQCADGGGYGIAAVAGAAGYSWIEDRRLGQLQNSFSGRFLSAHSDALAVYIDSDYSSYYTRGVQLMSSISGRQLSAQLLCAYRTSCLAVAGRALVTGGVVWLDDVGPFAEKRLRRTLVLDAHSLAYGQRLWRIEMSSGNDVPEEELQGVCADSVGDCLYATVCRVDRSSGRVSALSLEDGRELRRVMLSCHSPPAAAAAEQLCLLPVRLALSEDEAAAAEQQGSSSSKATICSRRSRSSSGGRRALLLAALCCHSTTKECRTVTLHRSLCDVPQ